jgi:hypothetical protein
MAKGAERTSSGSTSGDVHEFPSEACCRLVDRRMHAPTSKVEPMTSTRRMEVKKSLFLVGSESSDAIGSFHSLAGSANQREAAVIVPIGTLLD